MTKPHLAEPTRLMKRGVLKRDQERQDPVSLELWRGMKILSCAGEEVGFLAAVVEGQSGAVRGFLLVRPQASFEYRFVSAEEISEARESAITLTLTAPEVAVLPVYERSH